MLHSFQNIFLLTYVFKIIIHDRGQSCELANWQFEMKGTCLKLNILCNKFDYLTQRFVLYNVVMSNGFKVCIN